MIAAVLSCLFVVWFVRQVIKSSKPNVTIIHVNNDEIVKELNASLKRIEDTYQKESAAIRSGADILDDDISSGKLDALYGREVRKQYENNSDDGA